MGEGGLACLEYGIPSLRLIRHASQNDRVFRCSSKIPRRLERTPDVGVFRAAIECNQLHAVRALHLISLTESLRSFGKGLFALGTQNFNSVSHEISRPF
jgi:hypothetical protein